MQKILSMTRKACFEYNLIEDGDKIAVGLSGGKDSLTLLLALKKLQAFYDKKFDLVAISVDLSNGENDFSKLIEFCKSIDVEYKIVKTNITEIIFDIRKEKNPCSLCANLRRGVLNSTAKELGCNKVALGHHKDDLIETFLLSLFFEGRLSTFKPKTYLSRVDLDVIRPFIFVSEEDVKRVSKDFPVLFNPCPANKYTQRESAKQLLTTLDKTYPDAKEKIFNAIIHSERYNLFDKLD